MNSENCFIKFGISTKEFIKGLKKIGNALAEASMSIVAFTHKDKSIKKILHIYKNNKKYRVRKKQLSRMRKIINKIEERKTKDNDI